MSSKIIRDRIPPLRRLELARDTMFRASFLYNLWMHAHVVTSTNKIIKVFNNHEKVIYYPLDDFVDEIVNADSCFICGVLIDSCDKKFSDEHIIPRWLLRRFNLYNEKIRLPNNYFIQYASQTLPCCEECNGELSRVYETPLRNILKPEYKDFKASVTQDDGKLIFKWLSLIFIKNHLKDKERRFELDRRIESPMIADTYDWGPMHHIWCVARSHYSQADIGELVYGTMIAIPIVEEDGNCDFDYMDSHSARVIAVKVGDYAVVAVLDDAKFFSSVYEDFIDKIKGKQLSFIQLREVVSRMEAVNVNITNRPLFKSFIDIHQSKYKIDVEFNGEAKLHDLKDCIATPGNFLKYHIESRPDLNLNLSPEEIKLIEKNELNFLFDINGEFMSHINK